MRSLWMELFAVGRIDVGFVVHLNIIEFSDIANVYDFLPL